MTSDAAFDRWIASLEARHLADLRFPEVARALRALSSTYVERRDRLSHGAALSGAGKRAAFALFYGPLHYLIVEHIAQSLKPASETIVDLGCGTGAAGVACASACEAVDLVVGVDSHPWALTEAARTYRDFNCKSRTEKADVASTPRLDLPRGKERSRRSLFVAAFVLNELTEASRNQVMQRLIARVQGGDALLVVEPLAGFVAPWWSRWARAIRRCRRPRRRVAHAQGAARHRLEARSGRRPRSSGADGTESVHR